MKKYINKAESLVADWLKDVPHLPKPAQKWLSENVWWITIVGIVMGAIALLTGLMALMTALSTWGAVPYYYAYGVASGWTGLWVVNTIISFAFIAVTIAILAKAVTPLKAQKAAGWNLLFLVFLVNALDVVVGALFSFSVIGFIFSLIFGAIGLAISAYLLFEIKHHFVKK